MDQTTGSKHTERAETFAGCGGLGALATGVAGLLLALAAFLNGLNYMEAGVALIAAALAFGLLTNAIFRA